MAVVIDNGTRTLKAGFAGQSSPLMVLPSVVGSLRQTILCGKIESVDDINFIGDGALSRRSMLTLRYPVVEGEIVDWDAMECLLQGVYQKILRIAPELMPLLITEPLFPSLTFRQNLFEILFESLQVPKAYAISSSPLALFSTRRTTGLVVDSGDAFTSVVPILDGRPVKEAAVLSTVAGNYLTEKLQESLASQNFQLHSINNMQAVRDIKERLCFVAATPFKSPFTSFPSKMYELPDGQVISLGDQLFSCFEEIFRVNGLPTLIERSISKCKKLSAQRMSKNIVLAGGSTKFPGYAERLGQELARVSPPRQPICIYAPDDRVNMAWRGGSFLASFSNFQIFWLTANNYEENGYRRLDKYFH